MNIKSETKGHLFALFTVIVWGTTYISTKILLDDFSPGEVMLLRLIIGYLVLVLFNHRKFKAISPKHELMFALASFTGVTLYYYLENMAIELSLASNVGIIVSVAPFFTGLLASIFLKTEKLKFNFFIGFIAAIIGIVFVSYNGASVFKVNPLGDFLAVVAAFMWGIYSILTKKINDRGYDILLVTRRMFFYGIIYSIPMTLLFDNVSFDASRFLKPVNVLNLVYLGVCASAVCFLLWNNAIKVLGAVKTTVYIYLSPVVTIITSVIILGEKITVMAALGCAMTLFGLVFSEMKLGKNKS